MRLHDPRGQQHVPVEAHAGDLLTVEVRAEPAKRRRVAIDDRNRVPGPAQLARQRRPDSTAAHDHDVHVRWPFAGGSDAPGRYLSGSPTGVTGDAATYNLVIGVVATAQLVKPAGPSPRCWS